MASKSVPENPSVVEMLQWIASRYQLSLATLSRMFETDPSTIRHWLESGKISPKKLAKIRTSFYFLNNAKDPHANERKCPRCGAWRALPDFRDGRAVCRSCETAAARR